MRALDIKLFRDLWGVKGQVVAIAFVLAAGIATYVMAASTLDTLTSTQAQLYLEFRFPDLFSGLKRAPLSVLNRVAGIPGVTGVESRVVAPANIEMKGYAQPISGQIVSLPERGAPPMFNLLYVRAGRLPEPGRDREAVISDGFAAAHKLRPGFLLETTINGRQRRLEIVGIVSTPEFIYQLAPGSIVPDFKTYCVIWMDRAPLEAAFNMTGAFNQVVASLSRGTRVEDAIAALDVILRPYGGLGAHGRRDQVSHRYLSEEFKQLGAMATMFPTIFLSVAAFLLNVVIGRLMATQRGQIAILKAFGYTTGAMVWHFLKLASLIVALGIGLGFAGGAFVGIPIGKYLGFQPEALISQKGYQATGSLLGTNYSNIRTITYLDIPLQLQLKPIEFIALLAGFQYSYLVHQQDVYAFGLNSTAQEQEFKNDNPRKNLLGAVIGTDITIQHLLFSVKACWDLQNNVGDGSSFTPRYKNVWYQATVGFRFY